MVEQTTTIHYILLQSNFPLLFMLTEADCLFPDKSTHSLSIIIVSIFLYLIIIKSMSSRFMFLFFIYYYYYCYYYYGITIAYYDVRYKVMLKKTTRTIPATTTTTIQQQHSSSSKIYYKLIITEYYYYGRRESWLHGALTPTVLRPDVRLDAARVLLYGSHCCSLGFSVSGLKFKRPCLLCNGA